MNVAILLVAIIVFFITFLYNTPKQMNEKSSDTNEQIQNNQHPSTFNVPKKGLHKYIGMDAEKIMSLLGKPVRVEPSPYGYSWWIYKGQKESYLQVGIEDNKVVTIYALGKNLKTAPFNIGENSNDLYKKISFSDSLSLTYKHTKIKFELSEEDMMIRPLVAFDDIWVQLYFDHFTDKLMSVRYMNTETLIKQQPYTLISQGKLAQFPTPTADEWEKIEAGEEQQIFDITNILRNREGLSTLKWADKAANAAFLHSKEMQQKNYFSHDSPTYGKLGERLETAGVSYTAAGGNIAAMYMDGVAAVVGWLNSKGHRENMFNKTFTQLGVGVYRDYYTQNFVKPR